MAAGVLGLLPLLFATELVVEGGAECPGAASIRTELARILPVADRPAKRAREHARVQVSGEAIRVELFTPDGARVGEREVPNDGSCDERARTVAVILAAWITDIHPEYRSALPAAPAPEPSLPPVEPPRAVERPPRARPVAPAPTSPPRSDVAPMPPVRGSNALTPSLAAAAGVSISDTATAAAQVSVTLAPPRRGLGATAFVVVSLSEERALGAGRVQSFRWPLGAGVLGRVSGEVLRLDLATGPTVGWLHLEGDGFASNEGADDVAFGGFARARAGTDWGEVHPFVEVGMLGWFTRAVAQARLPNAELALPVVQAVVLFGVSGD